MLTLDVGVSNLVRRHGFRRLQQRDGGRRRNPSRGTERLLLSCLRSWTRGCPISAVHFIHPCPLENLAVIVYLEGKAEIEEVLAVILRHFAFYLGVASGVDYDEWQMNLRRCLRIRSTA